MFLEYIKIRLKKFNDAKSLKIYLDNILSKLMLNNDIENRFLLIEFNKKHYDNTVLKDYFDIIFNVSDFFNYRIALCECTLENQNFIKLLQAYRDIEKFKKILTIFNKYDIIRYIKGTERRNK